jgi:hypothetical protein
MDLIVTVKSTDGRNKQYEQRQWYIVMQETSAQRQGVKALERGQTMGALAQQSGDIVRLWQDQLMGGQVEASFMATQPEEKRAPLSKNFRQYFVQNMAMSFGTSPMDGWAGVLAFCRVAAPPEELMPGYHAYNRGDFVELDKEKFWPEDPKVQEAILTEVRKFFRRSSAGVPGELTHDPNRIFLWNIEGDRLLVEHDIEISLPQMQRAVDGVLIAECDASVIGTDKPADWRLTRFILKRSKRPQTPEGAPGSGPGGMPVGPVSGQMQPPPKE